MDQLHEYFYIEGNRVCFIYSTINDRYPQQLWKEKSLRVSILLDSGSIYTGIRFQCFRELLAKYQNNMVINIPFVKKL